MLRSNPVSTAPAPTSINRVTPRDASKRDGLRPADRIRDLVVEPFASLGARANLARLPVVDERNRRSRNSVASRSGFESVLRRLHQRTVKRRTHRQQNRPASAGGLGEFHRAIDRGRVAGDDDLIRGIEIRGAHDFALRGLRENRIELAGGKLEERRHRAHARRNRLPACTGRACGPVGRHRQSGAIRRRPVPSTRPGCGPRRKRARSPWPQHRMRGDRHRQQRRLRVLGQLELVVGAFKTQTRKRKPQRIVGFLEDAGGFGERIGEGFAHACELGTLTWEKKGCLDQLRFYRSSG